MRKHSVVLHKDDSSISQIFFGRQKELKYFFQDGERIAQEEEIHPRRLQQFFNIGPRFKKIYLSPLVQLMLFEPSLHVSFWKISFSVKSPL